jgi:hypothetical protein
MALGMQGFRLGNQGHLTQAKGAYARLIHLAAAAAPHMTPNPIASLGFTGLAHIAYLRNETEEALLQLRIALPMARQLDLGENLGAIYLLMGAVHLAKGAFIEARHWADRYQGLRAEIRLRAAAIIGWGHLPADILLAQGKTVAAKRAVQESDSSYRGFGRQHPEHVRRAIATQRSLALARIAIAGGHLSDAKTFLVRGQGNLSPDRHPVGCAIEMNMLLAFIYRAEKRVRYCRRHLKEALFPAADENILRPFLTSGRRIISLLADNHWDEPRNRFTQRVIATLTATDGEYRPVPIIPLEQGEHKPIHLSRRGRQMV